MTRKEREMHARIDAIRRQSEKVLSEIDLLLYDLDKPEQDAVD